MNERFYRHVRLVAAVLAIACLFAIGTSREFRATYHRFVFHNAATTPGWLIGGSSDQHRHELEMSSVRSLVDLGALEKRLFKFKNIKPNTPEGNHFRSVVMRRTGTIVPDSKMWLANLHDPKRSYYVEVYCSPSDLPAWELFVREYDVPDYSTKYSLTPPR